ncbi:hypothetical protein Athai_35430 [Actinocatenispora thailandica]|uniref:LamG-like jellyroll fold domain-containing protein n=1 Tax=Actinocatenispora thailandica TaxID=227318 RepID=A0A7R7DQI4_9ACTN|nr:LamG-like jellyroll fold domain-containing protein [Actinocatenispora thailandica]BCJ36040.1 hypothetical protein Athai_35430 [Actinocatenispora thailandica]
MAGVSWPRALFAGVALAVGVSLAAVAPGGVHAAPPAARSGAVAGDAGPQAPADQVSAMRKAHLSKQRVEIVSQRTESSQTFAEPDGTITKEATPRPARVHASDGSWAAVDTSLTHDANGAVVPASTSAGLRFSAGGDGPMATISSAGKSLSLQWPHGSLPAPTLDGSSAIYADVLPGVDLRLSAMVDGFSEVLVVKTREAADNPDLASLQMGLAVDGVSVSMTESGVLTAVDAAGATVFGAPSALMWDSSDPSAPVADVAKHAAAPASARTARVDTALNDGGDGLTLIPDPGMLSDPDTVFPVFVDPDVSTSISAWTYVDNQFADQAYMSSKGRSDAPAGRYLATNGGEYIQRSYIMFKFGASLANTKVVKAEFRAYSHYQWNSTPTYHQVQSWTTAAPTTATTWNNQPGHVTYVGAHNVKAGTWVGFDATAAVQHAADGDWKHLAFELRAVDESTVQTRETYSMSDSTQPKLAVTIDRQPNTPTGLKMSPCYKACSAPAIVSSKYPAMYASVSDPDGGNLKVVQIEVYTADGATKASYTYNTLTNIKSGSSIKWTSPSPRNLTSGYKWHARACDADSWCSGWSSWFNFSVDTDNPTTPTVSSTDYPALVAGSEVWSGGVGQAGTFEFGPHGATGVVEYRWSLDRTPPGTEVAATNNVASVSVTPATDGVHRLYVQSVDSAGNVSEIFEYEFGVQPAPGNAGYWTFDEGAGTTAGDMSSAGHTATLNNGVGWVPGHVDGGSAIALDGTDQYASTDTAVIDTTGGSAGGGFSVSAWVYLDDNSRYHTVLAQDGAQSSAFYLQYRSAPDGDCWAFGMRDADTADGVTTVALSHDKAWLQEWTHLVGVYDAVNHQLRLYVNGVLQPDHPDFSSPIASTSPLNIGRGLHGGQIGWYWQGQLDNVRVYQRVLSDNEIYYQAHEADFDESVSN